ncbi:MAG: 2,3-bisphosphoglycerate-dependent phosphoglycerate mutase [Actinomycetota bacterium]|nr:2,3-bisphosphoglycerate-dependent phosphoglycerate mutase [Actinomycetota bacterium]
MRSPALRTAALRNLSLRTAALRTTVGVAEPATDPERYVGAGTGVEEGGDGGAERGLLEAPGEDGGQDGCQGNGVDELYGPAGLAVPSITGPAVLLRHGRSESNESGRCGGWQDAPLTPEGEHQAREAALNLARSGLMPDSIHTSMLTRAITTAQVVADELGVDEDRIVRTWRLNERNAGALEGLTRQEMIDGFGRKEMKRWRRNFDVRPPALDPEDPRHPLNDRRYRGIPADVLPDGESILDATRRLLPYWHGPVAADLEAGKCVLVVGHAHLFRGLRGHLEQMSDEALRAIPVENGSAQAYWFAGRCRVLLRRELACPSQQVLVGG